MAILDPSRGRQGRGLALDEHRSVNVVDVDGRGLFTSGDRPREPAEHCGVTRGGRWYICGLWLRTTTPVSALKPSTPPCRPRRWPRRLCAPCDKAHRGQPSGVINPASSASSYRDAFSCRPSRVRPASLETMALTHAVHSLATAGGGRGRRTHRPMNPLGKNHSSTGAASGIAGAGGSMGVGPASLVGRGGSRLFDEGVQFCPARTSPSAHSPGTATGVSWHPRMRAHPTIPQRNRLSNIIFPTAFVRTPNKVAYMHQAARTFFECALWRWPTPGLHKNLHSCPSTRTPPEEALAPAREGPWPLESHMRAPYLFDDPGHQHPPNISA